MSKMIKTSRTKCKKCKYREHFNGSASGLCCMYYVQTGLHRDCPVGWCDKFVKRNDEEEQENNKKWTDNLFPKSKPNTKYTGQPLKEGQTVINGYVVNIYKEGDKVYYILNGVVHYVKGKKE